MYGSTPGIYGSLPGMYGSGKPPAPQAVCVEVAAAAAASCWTFGLAEEKPRHLSGRAGVMGGMAAGADDTDLEHSDIIR